jgi:hypothetical protein
MTEFALREIKLKGYPFAVVNYDVVNYDDEELSGGKKEKISSHNALTDSEGFKDEPCSPAEEGDFSESVSFYC